MGRTIAASASLELEALPQQQEEELALPPEPRNNEIAILKLPGGIETYYYAIENPYVVNPREYPGILIYKSDNGGAGKLITKDGVDPNIRYINYSISPDGKQIAALVNDRRNNKSLIGARVVDIDTGRSINLQERTIVEDELIDINYYNIARGNIGFIYHNNTPQEWSYDGKFVSSETHGMVWDAHNNKVTSAAGIAKLAWSPKQNEIASATLATDGQYRINMRGGDNRGQKISKPILEPWSIFEWTADGDHMIFDFLLTQSDDSPRHLRIVDREGNVVSELAAGTRKDRVSLSPDHKYALVSAGDGKSVTFIDIARRETKTLRFRDVFPGFKPTYARISDDTLSGVTNTQQGEEVAWLANDIVFIILPHPVTDTIGGARGSIQERKSRFQRVAFLSLGEVFAGGVDLTRDLVGSRGKLIPIQDDDDVGISDPNQMRDGKVVVSVPGGTDVVDYKTGKKYHLGKGGFLVLGKPVKEAQITNISSGEVLDVGGELYLFLDGKKYRVNNPETFARRRNGMGRTILTRKDIVDRIPDGEVSNKPFILDQYGFLRRNNGLSGGIKLAFGSGLFSATGIMSSEIALDSTFPDIRRDLSQGGWESFDQMYLSYKKGFFGYSAGDTLQDPLRSIELFSQQIQEWKENHPGDKIDFFFHSHGGAVGLHALFNHLDIVRNIFLFAVPIWGVADRGLLGEAAKGFIPKVEIPAIGFLLRAFMDPGYKKRVNDIVREIQNRGIGLYQWTSTDDLMVRPESAIIGDAKMVINGRLVNKLLSLGASPFSPLLSPTDPKRTGHGQVLDSPQIMGWVREIVGKNPAVEN